MEPNRNLSEAQPRLSSRFWGVVTLVLIFFASAGVTLAYLSNIRVQAPTASQAAAAVLTEDPFAGIQLTGESAYVLDLTSGHVLYSLNPDIQLPLASLTKIALVLAASEVLSPDTVITIPRNTSPKGSAEHLGAGEQWRVGDVIAFILVASSNEGAQILAEAANDALAVKYPNAPKNSSTDATLWRMNDLAKKLGLTRTYFLNANGLDLSTTQAGAFGSARDTATLFAYAATTSPDIFAGTARDGLLLLSESGNKTSAFNTDKALEAIPGVIMGKTGYTDLAGGNLAVLFDVGPAHPVVAVIMHSSEQGRFDDMKKLVRTTQAAVAAGR